MQNVTEKFGSVMSNNDSVQNKLSHGTSPKAIARAFKSYLNITGAGDYDLPSLFGSFIRESDKKN